MNVEFESFEEAMEVLKTTVNKFDGGKSLNLEDLIQNYEKGMLAFYSFTPLSIISIFF